jgi:hypothetical protein
MIQPSASILAVLFTLGMLAGANAEEVPQASGVWPVEPKVLGKGHENPGRRHYLQPQPIEGARRLPDEPPCV